MLQPLVITIAGIAFALRSERPEETLFLEPVYKSFETWDPPEVWLTSVYDPFFPGVALHSKNLKFDSGGTWVYYKSENENIVVLVSPPNRTPYRIAVYDKEFRVGRIYHTQLQERDDSGAFAIPSGLEWPLGQLNMVNLLARERGIMLHACGIDDSGRGYLCAGNSGHGKSTLARLWSSHASILNDERIVLRREGDVYWIYGTPWYGEYSVFSSHSVPVEKIFFLYPSKVNTISRIKGATAVTRLIARMFPPFWDSDGMRFTLDLCNQLVASTPCYDLGFTNTSDTLEFMRCVK
jgi:hypothetical protein